MGLGEDLEASEMMLGGDSFRDIDPKVASKLKNLFYDRDARRCTLCNDAVTSWPAHQNFVPHQARQGIVERLLSGKAGPPDKVASRWWSHLNQRNVFERIMELSASNSEERRRRLVYLLHFLQEKGILREAFSVSKGKSLHRSWEFERFEMIGDNVLKYCFYDRMLLLFPTHEGGVNGRLNFIQQLIDSNDGLLKCYDYLEFDRIIGNRLAASKFKSDVVEAVFGELQVYLWATECEWGSVAYAYPFKPEVEYTRGLVNHALNELIHVLLMWAIESTLKNAGDTLKELYKPAAATIPAAQRKRLHLQPPLSNESRSQSVYRAVAHPRSLRLNVHQRHRKSAKHLKAPKVQGLQLAVDSFFGKPPPTLPERLVVQDGAIGAGNLVDIPGLDSVK